MSNAGTHSEWPNQPCISPLAHTLMPKRQGISKEEETKAMNAFLKKSTLSRKKVGHRDESLFPQRILTSQRSKWRSQPYAYPCLSFTGPYRALAKWRESPTSWSFKVAIILGRRMLTGVFNLTQEGTNAGSGFQDISPQSEDLRWKAFPELSRWAFQLERMKKSRKCIHEGAILRFLFLRLSV